MLGAAGFDAYEVSNHARGEAARSRHNLIYWRGGEYTGRRSRRPRPDHHGDARAGRR